MNMNAKKIAVTMIVVPLLLLSACTSAEGLKFSVKAGPVDRYGGGQSLVGGLWEGETRADNTVLRVSFYVDAAERSVSQIKYEVGCEGQEMGISWTPADSLATIRSDGYFRYQDAFENFIEGHFGSGTYAYGTVSAVPMKPQCADGKVHSPPTQWRAAPK